MMSQPPLNQDALGAPSPSVEQNSAQLPEFHKYKYAVFDGLNGERYLFSLAQRIAPFAIWRTWYAAVSYQAPDGDCYVGVPRLTDERDGRVGVQERKIYLDLAAMEERGWLVQEYVQKPFKAKDDTVVLRVVPQKNFDGFYDAAYDYHLWLSDTSYIAPKRHNVPLIRANADLLKRLIKFENYRRLLVCAKPGRKPQTTRQDFYACQLEKLQHQESTQGNTLANTPVNKDSLYRIPRNSQSTTTDRDSESSIPEREERVGEAAIRNLNTRSSTHEPNPNPRPQEQTPAGEAVKDASSELGYTEAELEYDTDKRGAALVGIPAEQYAKLNGGKDQLEQDAEAQRRTQVPELPTQMRPAREIPLAVTRAITEFAKLYDKKHLIQSDVTRIAKIYFTAAQTIEGFTDTLFFALFDEARKAAMKKTNCTYTDEHGRVNRMPFFFTCLENAFSFSLEEMVYLRADDPLYSDYSLWDVTDKVHDEYQRLFNTGQITDDYRTWLCDILDLLEKRKEPKQRLNKTIRS